MRPKSATPDTVAAEIAGQQHGVIARRQLLGAGLDGAAIARRIRSRRLHRLHRSVYAWGHRGLSTEGRWMAAVLACGEGAVLSHRSAAGLWGMFPPASADGTGGTRVDVALPSGTGRRRRAGIRIHRCPSLTAELATRHRDIPVTTPARTITDLRSVTSPAELRRAIRQAEVAGLRTGLGPRRQRTRSELEEIFLTLCRKHGIPTPEVNVRVGRHEVDFVWRKERVAVETDGYRYHRGPTAFEDDHERELALRAASFDLVRLTYRQLTTKPTQSMASVEEALRDAATRPSSSPS